MSSYFEHGNETSGTTNGKFLDYLRNQLLKKNSAAWRWLEGLKFSRWQYSGLLHREV